MVLWRSLNPGTFTTVLRYLLGCRSCPPPRKP